jgi:hypothetical protein
VLIATGNHTSAGKNMDLFSRLFRKKSQEDLWSEFQNRPNDQPTLREKAVALAPLLIQLANLHAGLVRESVLPSEDMGTLLFEYVVIELHLIDRTAFEQLGAERRSWLMDPLGQEVADRLSASSNGDVAAVCEILGRFPEMYNARINAYASLDIVAQPDERGGYNLTNTIGWKFAEILGQGDGFAKLSRTGMALMYDVADLYIAMLDWLQLRQLVGC